MSRHVFFAGCALAIVLSLAAPARAQFGGRGLGIPPSVQTIMMLRSEAVQKELSLSDDQKQALAELGAQMQQEAMEIFSGLQDLNEQERKEQLPELMKMMNEKGKELQTKVDKILEGKQLTRIRELSLQRRGMAALEDESVSAGLKLSDEQKKKLEAIQDEAVKRSQEIFEGFTSGGGGDQGALREKVRALHKELGDKALDVLTTEQREQFEKMKGAKFDFGTQRGFGF